MQLKRRQLGNLPWKELGLHLLGNDQFIFQALLLLLLFDELL